MHELCVWDAADLLQLLPHESHELLCQGRPALEGLRGFRDALQPELAIRLVQVNYVAHLADLAVLLLQLENGLLPAQGLFEHDYPA